MEQVQGALSGLRVLDLSRILAGPFAAQLLGDLGAEVIRVMRPGGGDPLRQTPPFLKGGDGHDTEESSLYLSCNRNKQSVTVDISAAEGQAIVRRLAAQCDILIENYKVGDLARYGLDYVSLRAINPRLIYCSITGFGQTGPYKDRPGYDSVFQAYSGMMSLTGHPDEEPNGGPLKTGPSMADLNGGMYAAFAVLAAVHRRHATGEGQHIDVGLLDTTVALVGHLGMQTLVAGLQPPRCGNGNPSGSAATNVYRCADASVLVSAGTDGHFRKLCALLGIPELALDERGATLAARVRNRAFIDGALAAAMTGRSARPLLEALEQAGIPAAPVNELAQAYDDPQVRARGMVVQVPHPLSGEVKLVANPLKFSATPVTQYTAPPLPGQHTDVVLRELLGMSAREIETLRSRAIV